MRIFVPLLFVFLLQNLFLFRCWCCCQHHASQQAVSVSRCSSSKTRALYSFSSSSNVCLLLLNFFFSPFCNSVLVSPFSRLYRSTEEQKKPTRATNARRMPLCLNHTTLSKTTNVLNNLLIKTDFTGQKRHNEDSVFTTLT